MHPSDLKSLRTEKLICSLLITVLLVTMVFMSSQTLLVRDENEKFRQEIQAVNAEIDLIMDFLPQKDSLITVQEREIIRQIKIVQTALNDHEITRNEKEALLRRLTNLKSEALQLKQYVATMEEQISYTTPQLVSVAAVDYGKEDQLQAYAQEIKRLKATIEQLQYQPAEAKIKTPPSAFYFMAYPSDGRNRHHRTTHVTLQIQLKGDLNPASCRYLNIEVRDPNNRIVSSPADRIRASSELLSEYRFAPDNYKFVKGRYSVRAYCEEYDFQSVTFFNLL